MEMAINNHREDYEIAVICALPVEAGMVQDLFDQFSDLPESQKQYGRARGDRNTYTYGVLGLHKALLVHMPGIGIASAATVAAWVRFSYPNVRIAFVVGVCGVVPEHPDTKEEIFLGDCIISTSFVKLDFGRLHSRGFARKTSEEDGYAKANPEIRSLIAKLKTAATLNRLEADLVVHLQHIQHLRPSIVHPGLQADKLYDSSYVHDHASMAMTCRLCVPESGVCNQECDVLGCDDTRLIRRRRLQTAPCSTQLKPRIHFGSIGSSNTVMRSGMERDTIAAESDIIAFEMEGAGVSESLPTVIIKAGCDYADSHKNKRFQPFAAATAAACLRAVLSQWTSVDPSQSGSDHRESKSNVPSSLLRKRTLSDSTPRPLPDLKRPQHSKAYYQIPLPRNPRFIGRDQKLRDLVKQLLINESLRELSLYGLGGVGKSQLALAFCYLMQDQYPEYSVFWVSALSLARFLQDFSKIASTCLLHTNGGEQSIIQDVREFLNSKYAGKWLLVVDNADEKDVLFDGRENVRKYLPNSSLGRILFTSRRKDIAVELTNGCILNLQELDRKDATHFMRDYLSLDDTARNNDLLEKLLDELTCLPLAMTQACSYILKTSISVSSYLDLLQSEESEMMKLLSRKFWDITRDGQQQSHNPVAIAWIISFEYIKTHERAAAELLLFLACIENKVIPLSLLPRQDSLGDLLHSIGILQSFSFLSADLREGFYTMHRLVHSAVKIWMVRQEIMLQQQAQVLTHLEQVFPSHDWENKDTWRDYMPHAIRLVQDTKTVDSRQRADLCLQMGRCMAMDRRRNEAVIYATQGASWRALNITENDSEHAYAQLTLGRVLLMDGDVAQSIKVLQTSLTSWNTMAAHEHPIWWEILTYLGVALVMAGQYSQGIEKLRKVLSAPGKTLPVHHVARLTAQHYLGVAYDWAGQPQKAIPILENVVETLTQILPIDHPDYAISRASLARALTFGGQSERAVVLMKEIMDEDSTSCGTLHLIGLMTGSQLAQVFWPSGQPSPLIERFERTIHLREGLYPRDHPYTMINVNYLAHAYMRDGEVKRGLTMLQQIIQNRPKLPKTHPHRLLMLQNLSLAFEEHNKLKEAIPLMQEVVDRQREMAVSDNPGQQDSRDNLTRMLSKAQPTIKHSEERQAVNKASH